MQKGIQSLKSYGSYAHLWSTWKWSYFEERLSAGASCERASQLGYEDSWKEHTRMFLSMRRKHVHCSSLAISNSSREVINMNEVLGERKQK